MHGTADEVIPAEKSVEQYEQLKNLGIKTALLLVEDDGHGLVGFSSGFPLTPTKGSTEAYNRALEFIAEAFNAYQ